MRMFCRRSESSLMLISPFPGENRKTQNGSVTRLRRSSRGSNARMWRVVSAASLVRLRGTMLACWSSSIAMTGACPENRARTASISFAAAAGVAASLLMEELWYTSHAAPPKRAAPTISTSTPAPRAAHRHPRLLFASMAGSARDRATWVTVRIIARCAAFTSPGATDMPTVPVDRRTFLAASSAALASAALAPLHGAETARTQRLALAGTGSRGSSMWGENLVRHYADRVELVGLFDRNPLRARAAQRLIGTSAPVFDQFVAMLQQATPDAVIIATVDATHAQYIVRALVLGFDVITEKPMCTSEEQCQAILDVVRRTGRHVTVTLNARHTREAKKVKALLQEGAIGEVLAVDFHEYLDTSHGADYFRRWHRFRENSGTLLCHKASHHFDLANWWLDSDPVDVSASGALRMYGRNHPFRGTNCRPCAHKAKCDFAWDD